MTSQPHRESQETPPPAPRIQEVVRLTTTDRLWDLLQAHQTSAQAQAEALQGIRHDMAVQAGQTREELIKVAQAVCELRGDVKDMDESVKALQLTPLMIKSGIAAALLLGLLGLATIGTSTQLSWGGAGASGSLSISAPTKP